MRDHIRARQPFLRACGIRRIVEAEQGRPADAAPIGPGGEGIEPPCLAGKPVAGAFGPGMVGQRHRADLDRGAADGPGSGHLGKPCDVARGAEDEAQPQARKSIELPERPQDEDAGGDGAMRGRSIRGRIREALVHDEASDAPRKRVQRVRAKHAAVRVVRVDDDRQIGADQCLGRAHLLHAPA